MISASGSRLLWEQLPAHVQRQIELIAGGRVVEAVTQPGGFSPGVAARLRLADGGRAFVKAVSPEQNADTPTLHRREAVVAAALPVDVPVPKLLGSFDDGYWVALVFEDIDGRHPVVPWVRHELDAVMAAFEQLAQQLTPCPLDARPAAEGFAAEFRGWDRIACDLPPDLDPWAAANLDQLRELAAAGLEALVGDTLVHADARADNLLIDRAGLVHVLDWPWACRGPSWFDSVGLLVNVALYGGDPEAELARLPIVGDVDPAVITGFLSGLAGFFLDRSRLPAGRGLPTVRAFQAAQGASTLAWLRNRLS
ncbi:MAG: aminoglycoside phosphotransferase family protein [Frankiales bacterium]|nr:MAG: aminoglycoside phosphotransferase family protein [Frankiales bacterium]